MEALLYDLESIPQPGFNNIEGFKLRFDLKGSQLNSLKQELIAKSTRVLDEIGSLSPTECNFETVFKPLSKLEVWRNTWITSLNFPQYVSTNKSVREASSIATIEIEAQGIEDSMREDVYNAVLYANNNIDINMLDEEDIRFIEKINLDYKRTGLHLPKDKQIELKKHFKQMSDICNQFNKNIVDDETVVLFTKKELKGLTNEFINGLDMKNGKYVVTMKYPDVTAVLCDVINPETRKLLDYTNGSRCKDNVKLLEKSVSLRIKIAKLLGYDTYADYQLEVKMAKTPDTVEKFLTDIRSKLTDVGKMELEDLLKLKRKEEPNATELKCYDLSYYKTKLLNEYYHVDDNKEYFPIKYVTEQMLDIYQTILSLEFDTISDPQPYNQDNPEDVTIIRVRDKESKELMGYFYLDLHPRIGKYTHAACFPIQLGCDSVDGSQQLPIAAMVSNFSKPSGGRPSLLRHSEVTTYFHELGHVMHHICSRTKYARFHGLTVEGDFVEAPSQMLENWCWDPATLKKLSCHFETGKQIPYELVSNLIDSKNVGVAMHYLRQLSLGIFDMSIHTISIEGHVDTTKAYNEMRKNITLVAGQSGSFPAATFGHIMGGYDAGYYGYLWSQVFSCDMFHSQFKANENINDDTIGIKYRRCVLNPGSSKDGMQLLRDFLGREPNLDAFINDITAKPSKNINIQN